MKQGQSLWRQFGGYLVMLVISAMIIVWWRSYLAGQLVQNNGKEAVAVAAAASVANGRERAVDNAAALPLPSANLTPYRMADLPILYDYSLSPNYNPRTFQGNLPTHELITYTVEFQDTPGVIA